MIKLVWLLIRCIQREVFIFILEKFLSILLMHLCQWFSIIHTFICMNFIWTWIFLKLFKSNENLSMYNSICRTKLNNLHNFFYFSKITMWYSRVLVYPMEIYMTCNNVYRIPMSWSIGICIHLMAIMSHLIHILDSWLNTKM